MQEKWDSFWMIEKMDDKLALHTLQKFGVQDGKEMSGRFQALIEQFSNLQEKIFHRKVQKHNTLQKKWVDMVLDFTGGDSSLLPDLYQVYLNRGQIFDLEWNQKWENAEHLMQEALQVYLLNHQAENPFIKQETKED